MTGAARARALGRGVGAGLFLACASAGATVAAGAPEFTLHKRGPDGAGPTLLVIGGIQGDEPGGFNAASLLVTHYRIERGRLWVVPNLNFASILRRTRGVHGDMNRKFPDPPPGDPDAAPVEKIKRIITAPAVDLVVNLHDGSGFYRPRHHDRMHGPARWGQSIIIDQESIDAPRHGRLGDVARATAAQANRHLRSPEHAFHVKNTRTREGDREMAKTLTYFAINRAKPAFGVEASKSLPTHLRVYYHLVVLESFMRRLGVRFSRRFDLRPRAVREAVDNNVRLSLYDARIFLDMHRARRRLGYFPVPRGRPLEFEASSPLVAILPAGRSFRVRYGNRRVTVLDPEPMRFDSSLDEVSMVLDGRRQPVPFGTLVEVRDSFVVEPPPGYRANVIGWRRPGLRDDARQRIERGALARRFSVDRDATTYRTEIYRRRRFCGMVLVRFTASPGGEVVSFDTERVQ